MEVPTACFALLIVWATFKGSTPSSVEGEIKEKDLVEVTQELPYQGPTRDPLSEGGSVAGGLASTTPAPPAQENGKRQTLQRNPVGLSPPEVPATGLSSTLPVEPEKLLEPAGDEPAGGSTRPPPQTRLLDQAFQEPGPRGDTATPNAEKLFSASGMWGLLGGGLEAARGVAELVSAGFSPPPVKVTAPSTSHVFAGFLRLLGFDKSKLGAIALNALIFIAQLIGSSLSADTEDTKEPIGTPASWIFDNSPPQVGELVKISQDRSLPEKVMEGLREGSRYETDCVQLLVCKLEPVVWGMQGSLRQGPDPAAWKDLTNLQIMFAHLPSAQQMADHGSRCEMRFPTCRLKYSKP